jgi:hypothetical protein
MVVTVRIELGRRIARAMMCESSSQTLLKSHNPRLIFHQHLTVSYVVRLLR